MKSDFRFQILDLLGNRRIPSLRVPRSTLRARPRCGVTIIEVLFAILITTVGLFGALAIFPVASSQARRARLNDMLAAAGRSAFHDFDTRGMRRPDRWLAWDAINNSFKFVSISPSSPSPPNLQAAESFCIDPRMIAANMNLINYTLTNSSVSGTQCVQFFPYMEPFRDTDFNGFYNNGDQQLADLNNNGIMDPYEYVPSGSIFNYLNAKFDSTFMRRISLWSGAKDLNGNKLAYPMTLQQANAIFMVTDDLSYDRPVSDKSAPAKQNLSVLPSPAPVGSVGTRLDDGKISWIATIVPEFDASGQPSDQYTLSVVMLYERSNDLSTLNNKMERAVFGQWVGGNTATGGTVLLQGSDPEQLKVRPNDWVMVSGSGVFMDAATATPKLLTRFQWYRITDCDAEPTANANNAPAQQYELYATVMGQDWNTFFNAPSPAGASSQYGVRVTIVEGAYAVYEKSIRLEYGNTF